MVLFGENRMRLYIAAAWLIGFIIMYTVFNSVLPNDEFAMHLNKIEQSVAKKNWADAKRSMDDLKHIYAKKKSIIQINNATEIYTNFELVMGQLDASVENKQEAAVEYVGALRASLDFVMKAFSGP